MRSAPVIVDTQDTSPREVHGSVDIRLLPEIADVLDHLALHDPDVLAAVEDVDRSLIWEAMQEAPLARLSRSAQQARFYGRLRVIA